MVCICTILCWTFIWTISNHLQLEELSIRPQCSTTTIILQNILSQVSFHCCANNSEFYSFLLHWHNGSAPVLLISSLKWPAATGNIRLQDIDTTCLLLCLSPWIHIAWCNCCVVKSCLYSWNHHWRKSMQNLDYLSLHYSSIDHPEQTPPPQNTVYVSTAGLGRLQTYSYIMPLVRIWVPYQVQNLNTDWQVLGSRGCYTMKKSTTSLITRLHTATPSTFNFSPLAVAIVVPGISSTSLAAVLLTHFPTLFNNWNPCC